MKVESWATVRHFEVREDKERSSWTTIYKRGRHPIESHLVMTRKSFSLCGLQVVVKFGISLNLHLCLEIAARRLSLITIIAFQDAEIDMIIIE